MVNRTLPPSTFRPRVILVLLGLLTLTILSVLGTWNLYRGEIHHSDVLITFVALYFSGLAVLIGEFVSSRAALLEQQIGHERLRMALVSGKSVAWDLDLRTGKDYWFGDLQTMFGITSQSLCVQVQDFYRYVHPDDRSRVAEAVASARENHGPYLCEFRMVREDGTVRWVNASGEFQYSTKGGPLRMLGVAFDITDQKRVTEALLKSEEKFSRAFRESPVALTVTSALDHRYIDINETFERVTGWKRAEVIGWTPFDIKLWVDQAERNRFVQLLLAENRLRDFEVRYRCKDGSEGVGLGSAELMEIEGEPCILSAIVDITDRKHSEQALCLKEHELAQAQRMAHVGSWDWDIETGITHWSNELLRIHGLDPAGPAPLFEDLPKLYTPETWNRLLKAMETFAYPDMEMEVIRPDGTRRWLHSRVEVTRNSEGTVTQLRGVSRDITEEKRIQGQLQESQTRIDSILDSAMDAIITVNEEQHIVLFNAAAEKMFQCTAREAMGTHLNRFIPPPFRAGHEELVAQFGQDGITRRTHGEVGELYALRSNGEAFPMEASISRAESGGRKLFTVIIRDIAERVHAEQAVRESEEKFRRLVEHIGEALIADDVDGRIIFANEHFLHLFRFHREQLPELRLEDCVAPEFRETVVDRHRRRVRGESVPSRYECEGLRADGSRVWLEVDVVPVTDAEKKTTGTQSVIRDITQRRRTEIELRDSEERFRRLVEHIGDALAVDDVSGRIVFANDQFLSLFGFRREEVQSIMLEDYCAPEFRAALRGRHDRRMRGEQELNDYEYEGLRRDGVRVWIEANVVPIHNPKGEIIGSQKLLRNITERKRTEHALRESEERFRLVANTAPVMIWMSNINDQCTYVNKPWLDFTGRTIEQALAGGWHESVHPADLEAFIAGSREAFRRRETVELQYRLRRNDGQYRWILDLGVPRFNPDGSFAGYIGSCIDITERKLAEDALSTIGRRLIEAHEEERTWIGRELHDDINQRLALLSVELDRSNETVTPNDGIGELVRHAQAVITQIATDIQRLSHRLHSSKLEYLGLGKAASSFCRELEQQAKVQVQFTHDGLPRSLPKETSLAVFRVLQEALQNAIKYSGVTTFNVDLRGTPESIELTVTDEGRGFDLEEAFTRQGLGLISMRERVQWVGGDLTVKSKPGSGTRIHARVPLNTQPRAMAG